MLVHHVAVSSLLVQLIRLESPDSLALVHEFLHFILAVELTKCKYLHHDILDIRILGIERVYLVCKILHVYGRSQPGAESVRKVVFTYEHHIVEYVVAQILI